MGVNQAVGENQPAGFSLRDLPCKNQGVIANDHPIESQNIECCRLCFQKDQP